MYVFAQTYLKCTKNLMLCHLGIYAPKNYIKNIIKQESVGCYLYNS